MIRPCTFGIEEEYLLVNLGSGQVPATPSLAVIGRCREALGRYFAQEMFRSQIELASPVFTNLHEAREFFQRSRQRLRVALAEEGMGPYAAASHPAPRGCGRSPRHKGTISSCSMTTAMWQGVACSMACMCTLACRQLVTACN